LIAIKTQTKPPVIIPGVPFEMINIGTAVAVFPGTTSGTYIDAGNVAVISNNLTKQTNNLYLFIPTTTNPSGLVYTGSPSWTVGGSAAIPAFNATANAFPSDVNITSATTVNSASNYSLTADIITGADSLIFAVHGPTKSILKTTAATLNSNLFTAAELATVGKGNGYIQISALKYKQITNSGKNYYIINQNVATLSASIQ
jgi:hypothetical protein